MLKDDADWNKVAVKDGQKLMMMGTADKVPEAPASSQVFLEDLPESEQDIEGFAKYGAGLQNLGNTCYMNSTVQCLYAVPELKSALQSYTATGGSLDSNSKLTEAAKGLFSDLTRSAQAVHPLRFLLMLRERFPQFGETNRQGQYSQQDAEECWTQLVYTLKETLKVGLHGYAGREQPLQYKCSQWSHNHTVVGHVCPVRVCYQQAVWCKASHQTHLRRNQ